MLRVAAEVASPGTPLADFNVTNVTSDDDTSENMRVLEGALISHVGQKRIIIPVEWDPVRLPPIFEIPLEQPNLQRGELLRPELVLDMLAIGWAAILCIPKARSLLQKIALAICTLLFLIAMVIVPCILLTMFATVLSVWDHRAENLAVSLVIIAVGIILLTFVKRFHRLLTSVGSVWRVVGAQKTMDKFERVLTGTLDAIKAQAPNSNVVVLGYDLCSILVTRALAKKSPTQPVASGICLITVGSPIRRLARSFPGSILSVQELLKAYASSATVTAWANLWRDEDYIGRSFEVDSPMLTDVSIGDGYHRGTLSARSLWERVWAVAAAIDNSTMPELRDNWSTESQTQLSIEEQSELVTSRDILTVNARILISSTIQTNIFVLIVSLFERGPGWIFTTVAICVTLMLAGVFAQIAVLLSETKTERQELALLRYVRAPLVMGLTIVDVLTMFALPFAFWPLLWKIPVVLYLLGGLVGLGVVFDRKLRTGLLRATLKQFERRIQN